jgi:hypothetical protein
VTSTPPRRSSRRRDVRHGPDDHRADATPATAPLPSFLRREPSLRGTQTRGTPRPPLRSWREPERRAMGLSPRTCRTLRGLGETSHEHTMLEAHAGRRGVLATSRAHDSRGAVHTDRQRWRRHTTREEPPAHERGRPCTEPRDALEHGHRAPGPRRWRSRRRECARQDRGE